MYYFEPGQDGILTVFVLPAFPDVNCPDRYLLTLCPPLVKTHIPYSEFLSLDQSRLASTAFDLLLFDKCLPPLGPYT